MNEILKEFKIALSLDTKDFFKELANTESSVRKMGETLKNVLVGLFSYDTLKNGLLDFIDISKEIGENAKLLGTNSEYLQSLGRSLELYDGNMRSAESSIKSLNQAANDLRFGQGSLIEANAKYGISLRGISANGVNAKVFLSDLAKRFESLNAAQRMDLASMLGLDESMIKMLSLGKSKFDQMIDSQKKYGFYTERDRALSTEFKKAMLDLTNSFESSRRTLYRAILPAITALFKVLKSGLDYLFKHKALLISFLTVLASLFLGLAAAGLKMAIATAAAFAPFALAAAAIGAVAIALEDLYVYFEGGKSLIGEYAKKYKVLKIALEALRPAYEALKKSLKKFNEWLQNPSWDKFKSFLVTLKDAFLAIGEVIIRSIIEPLDYVFNKFLNWDFKGFLSSGLNWLGISPSGWLQSSNVTNNNNGGNTNIQNSNNIIINGSVSDQISPLILNQVNRQKELIDKRRSK